MIRLVFGVLLALVLTEAMAQSNQPVTTYSLNVASKTPNASSTITVTNTFQVVFTPSTTQNKRQGCTIVNYGTNTMWVYFGQPTDTPTKANSVQLVQNQPVSCATGNAVLNDQVWITGTSGDAFFAAQQ